MIESNSGGFVSPSEDPSALAAALGSDLVEALDSDSGVDPASRVSSPGLSGSPLIRSSMTTSSPVIAGSLLGTSMSPNLKNSTGMITPQTPGTPPSMPGGTSIMGMTSSSLESHSLPSHGLQHRRHDPLVQKRGLPPLSLSTSAPASPISPFRPVSAAVPSTNARQLFSGESNNTIFTPGSPTSAPGLGLRLPIRKRSVSGDAVRSMHGMGMHHPLSAINTSFTHQLEDLREVKSAATTPLSPRMNRPGSQKDKDPKKMNLYKTELCRSWEETGTCRYGTKCQFAHSIGELRIVDRHPKYKTEMCKTFWEKGTCPYGKRCCFIHTERDAHDKRYDMDNIDLKSPRTRSVSEGFPLRDRMPHSALEPTAPGFGGNFHSKGLRAPMSAYPMNNTDESHFFSETGPRSAFPNTTNRGFFSAMDEVNSRVEQLRLATDVNALAAPLSPFLGNGAAGTPVSTPVSATPPSLGSRGNRRGFPSVPPAPGLNKSMDGNNSDAVLAAVSDALSNSLMNSSFGGMESSLLSAASSPRRLHPPKSPWNTFAVPPSQE